MTTLIGIIIYLALLGLLFWIGKNYGIRCSNDAKEYDLIYEDIWDDIYGSLDKDPWNYDLINSKLIELSKLRYKDKERTNVLWDNFLIEWEKVK